MLVPVLPRALLVALFSLPGFLIIPRLSHAAEWVAEPSVRVASEYSDNIHLTTQPHNSVHGYTTAPKLNLGVRSDTWQLFGNAEYERKSYFEENSLDTNNQYFNLGSSYSTERSEWQLGGSLIRASTLTNQLALTGNYIQGYAFYFPVVAATETRRMHEVLNINPSWSWSMDERKKLQLSYNYASDSYVDGGSVGLSDNRTRGVSAKLTNTIGPADQIFLSGSYSIFRTPEVAHAPSLDIFTFISNAVNPQLFASEATSTSYQTGIAHSFTETMRGNLSVGTWHSVTKQLYRICPSPNPFYVSPGGSPLNYAPQILGPACLAEPVYTSGLSTQSSVVFSGGLETKSENTRINANASRSIGPGSSGDQVRTDNRSLAIGQSIAAKLTGNFSVSTSKYVSETGGIKNFDYTLFHVEPGIGWQWNQELLLNMSYRYTSIKRSWDSKPATSNYVYAGLSYQWPKLALSR